MLPLASFSMNCLPWSLSWSQQLLKTKTYAYLRTPGVVLMPGQLLPLWLLRRSELQTVEAALAAPKPLDRLLIVVSMPSRRLLCR